MNARIERRHHPRLTTREPPVAAIGNLGLLFGMLGIIVSLGAIGGWSYIWSSVLAWALGVLLVLYQWMVGRTPP